MCHTEKLKHDSSIIEFRRKRLWYSVLLNLVVTIWCIFDTLSLQNPLVLHHFVPNCNYKIEQYTVP